MYNVETYSIMPSPRRVRTYFNGVVVADSRNMVLFFGYCQLDSIAGRLA